MLNTDRPIYGRIQLLDADASEGRNAVEYEEAVASRKYLSGPLRYYTESILYVSWYGIVKRLCMEEGVDKVMNEHHLDALILPVKGTAATYAAYGGSVHRHSVSSGPSRRVRMISALWP